MAKRKSSKTSDTAETQTPLKKSTKVDLPPPPLRGDRLLGRRTVAAPRTIEKDKPAECGVCGSRFFEGEIYDAKVGIRRKYLCPNCYVRYGSEGVLYKFDQAKGAWFKMEEKK